MARIIEVTPQQLETAAKSIDQLAGEYQTQYQSFYRETGAMAQWRGADNQAFLQRIEGFKDDFEKMKNLMNQYADFLRRSAKAYRDTQDSVVKEAQSLTN